MTKDGKADGARLRVFFTTEPFVDYVWAARSDLDAPTQQAIVQAFLNLQPGKDDEILTILRGDKFVAADNAEYDTIRATAKQLNLF
jgi:ABC-type phosphate/phosphonate transport system substrate-binding protein